MILLVGEGGDRVVARVVEELRRLGARFAVADESVADRYELRPGRDGAVLTGGDCTGDRDVAAVFIRHAPVRSVVPAVYRPMLAFQRAVDRVLSGARCLVANRPHAGLSNYSKAYQLSVLSAAGLDVPRTLVTNDADRARAFAGEVGEVVVKGVSNSPTFARLLDAARLQDAESLRRSPVQFQERVPGVDHRVHVVGHEVFITTLDSDGLDYRRATPADGSVRARPGRLPGDVVAKCVQVTHALGLAVSGIDFKEDGAGRVCALELNPFPQFTYYEAAAGQPITRAVAALLARPGGMPSGLCA